MNDAADSSHTAPQPHRWRLWRRVALGAALVLLAYLVTAYVFMPEWWLRYVHHHPALDDTPGITLTHDGHPGDPINVAFIGSEVQLQQIMEAAGWFEANALGVKSDLKIAADTVLERPYDEAPVSNLYLWGRKEDIAFEQPVGHDPRQRHHVRFWKSVKTDQQGHPLWAGSVTFDKRVGLSHTTGQITHHIAADVDEERDRLFDELQKTGRLVDVQIIDGFHKVLSGRNGGGDPWHTDGRLKVGTIASPAPQ